MAGLKANESTKEWSPSRFWSQGGPIIERERIECQPNQDPTDEECGTGWECRAPGGSWWLGRTLLIAAMRAFVASKLGEEVEL